MRFSKYTALTPEKTALLLGTNLEKGLTESQADQNRQKYGSNEIISKSATWYGILIRQFQSSFIYLLIVASVVSFLLGEKTDALLIIIFILINVFLGFFQEFRSERTVQLLKQFVAHQAHVIRNGQHLELDSKELVVGDIVILEAGDVVPADLRIIIAHDLVVDESSISGESAQIRKTDKTLKSGTSHLFLAENIAFSGSTLTSGYAKTIVVAVGVESQFGKVSNLAQSTSHTGVFEKELSKLSNFILKLVFVTLLGVMLLNIFVKTSEANIIGLLLFSIALAVSVIPEALPVVVTFALSKGALVLAKNKVVVKRLASIEDLGSIEVLCTDKTGTLTENTLQVSDVFAPDSQKALFYAGICTSELLSKKAVNNSFDLAIFNKLTDADRKMILKIPKIEELPFDPDRKRNSVLVQLGKSYELIVRGAAEPILNFSNITAANKKQLSDWIHEKGYEGKRVIAVASKKLKKPSEYGEKFEEKGLELVGLISFVDPIKKTAFSAIKKAEKLGIQIKILTGDSKEISGAVAYAAGLIDTPEDVISGEELEGLSVNELADICLKHKVFARVSPEQKHLIIQTLKNFYNVGYLGEGINDAPALKAANVGIVVKEASDIARESADIILLKKSLQVVVDGIQEGRKVFANVSKYIRATLASNFGNFYAVAISTLFIKYLPMLPIQILLLNLLSDFPMISISGDTVDESELKTPSKFDLKQFAILASLLGVVSTCFDLLTFAIFSQMGEKHLQTYWFICSVLTELVFIYTIRTKGWFFKAKAPTFNMLFLTLTAAVVTVAIPFTFIGQTDLYFIKPELPLLGVLGGIVVLYFVVSELVKVGFYRSRQV